jgi:hypothetical protein
MRPWLAAGIATIGAVVFAAAPAHAAELTVTDDTGDAVGRGLDITSAQVRNRDSAVVATVTFDRNVRGDVIVSLDARNGSGLRIVHQHRLNSRDRTFVLPGSFTQEGVDRRCRAVSGDWRPKAASVTLRLPARCLDEGNYGAVRFAVLTEGGSGDTDFAPDASPQGPDVSGWIPRG